MADDPNATGGIGAPGAPPPAAGAPPAPGEGEREKFIPRERFDQVNTENADLKARVAYFESQQGQGGVAAPVATPAPQELPSDTIPQGYNNWEEWHASDPGNAIDWRARKSYQEERVKTEYVSGRQQFLKEVYEEIPDLKDGYKRNTHPVYQQFSKLLNENPASATSYAGLRQMWKLAKMEAGQSPAVAEAARLAGEAAERQRQIAAGGSWAPPGTGTPPNGGGAGDPQLNPDQQRMASKYGLSAKEYMARYGDVIPGRPSPGRIPMKYEKARR